MRAQSEAAIFAARPVAQVVTALLACPREVADLVLAESGVRETFDRAGVDRGDHFIVRNDRSAALDLHGKRRLLLEVEHVQRDVTDAERDRFIERLGE